MKKLTLVLSMMLVLVGLNANAQMYVIGDGPMGGWSTNNPTAMTDNGDGTYSFVVTLSNQTVYFNFLDGKTENTGDWTGLLDYRYSPASNGETPTTGQWVSTSKNRTGNAYKFYGDGEYIFTFDKANSKFMIDGYVAPIEITTYTVVSGLDGDDWPILEANDMTLVNGVYTLIRENVELTAGTLAYKIVGNHDWGFEWPQGYGINFTEEIPANGIYDITFTFDPATEEATCTLNPVQEMETFYTVAGTPASIFGEEWNPNYAANNMSMVDGLYTWTKTGVEATDTTVVQFKVVANGNWNTCWPLSDENGDNNWWYQFPETGTYDMVITFNEETKEILLTATKQGGEEPVEDTYTVAGTQNLFGSNWDPSDTNNDMVKGEDGIYTWTKTNYVVEEADTIEFKVVKNHSWDVASYPENNWWYAATAGTYDFVITFNPETSEVTFTPTKQGGEEPVEMVYTVVGPESIFGSNWNPADEANNMVKGEDGIYTWTKEEVTLYGNFEFKVVGNHDYAIYEWPMGPNNWVANLTEGEGIYTIAITFDPEAADDARIACTLTKTGDIAPVEHTYTVAGTQNLFGSNWVETDEANDMVKGEDGIYTWSKDGVEFAAQDVVEFKVVQDHAWAYAWPSSNWYWECEEDGTYNVVITFDPAADDMNKITFTATKAATFLRGDVDNNGEVKIGDVTALISYLLSGDASEVNLQAADCDQNGEVKIGDVTTLISYLLSGTWAE